MFGGFILATVNSGNIELNPTQGFNENLNLEQNFSRSFNGTLHNYKIVGAKQYVYNLPLTFVNSEKNNFINTNWEDDSVLKFIHYDTTSLTGFNLDVRISNRTSPLPLTEITSDAHSGVLQLISANGGDKTAGTLFILDDPVFGILDGTYNLLG